MRPALIILHRNLETRGITRTFEEQRMVFETLGGIAVLTETLAFAVVVIVINATEPIAGTLDTEMVVGVYRQLTRTCR